MIPFINFKTGFLTKIIMLTLLISLAAPQSLRALERKVYKVGIATDRGPFVFLSLTKEGMSLRGVYIDVMTQIAHHMNAEFEYIKCSDPGMMMNLLNEEKIDIIGFTLKIDEWSINTHNTIPVGLNITSWMFVNKSCQTIVCEKDLAHRRVAVISFDELGRWPVDTPDDAEIFPVPSPLEGLILLNKGYVDAFIAPSERVAAYIIQKEGLGNIQKVGLALRKTQVALSLPKANKELNEKLIKAIEKTKTSGVIHQIENKWYGVEFKKTFFEKYSRLILSGIGFVLLVLGFVVTWNHQLKKQVRKITHRLDASENRCRDLIESSPDMIFVVSRDGKIYTLNREARFLMPPGFDTQGFLPNIMQIVSPKDRKEFLIFLETVFTSKRLAEEFRFKDRKIGYREIDVAATVLPSEPGEEQRACLFARDVTQRNRIERDLVQTDRMTLLGQMAADIAHEINNPIGIVRTNIDVILARGWFTPEAKEFLESCQRNTIRAGEVTKELLAMVKPKAPEMEKLDLWELINDTIKMMGAQLKNVTIRTKTKGELALILGDRNLLQQVLINLLLNAVVALKKNAAPEINITCCTPINSDMVRLSVEDNGVGIPKDNLNEVFEPFFTQGKKEGFGLGLFVSQRIIENHNGIIYAESEIDIGTRFIIELPLFDKGNSAP